MARRPMRAFEQVVAFLAALQAQSRDRRQNLVIVGGTLLGMPNVARHVLQRVAAILQLPSFFEMTVER